MLHENITDVKVDDLIKIVDEINFLDKRLTVELLTSSISNKSNIQKFIANEKGKLLEIFLKKDAWKQDLNNEIRVYLVKDRLTNEILFYFALKTGLLFESITEKLNKLSEVEQEIVNTYIDAYFDPKSPYTPESVFDWYEGIPIDTEKLNRVIETQIYLKSGLKLDNDLTGDSVNVLQVSKTFPGLVITHFCKNVNTTFKENFSFPLGFYVFWEIIAELILKISDMVGFQYIYIFAADHTEQPAIQSVDFFNTEVSNMDLFTMSNHTNKPKANLKLVDYYKNEFKFEEVEDMTVLKPSYDFYCHSLVQNVNDLIKNREIAWEQISK